MRHTSTYAELEVSPETFDDIKARLEAAGVLDEYLDGDKIIFGTVALVIDNAE